MTPLYTLESVNIYRNSWEKNSPLHAVVSFKTGQGKIEINLDEAASAAVLAVIADQIVAAATLQAADMKAAFVEGARQTAAYIAKHPEPEAPTLDDEIPF